MPSVRIGVTEYVQCAMHASPTMRMGKFKASLAVG